MEVGAGATPREPQARPAVPLAVRLDDVTVTFALGNGGGYIAVERASLSVADGEFVAIVGPTGCGKSTLLNIAAGLIAPTLGRVDLYALPLAGLNRQAGFQADALFPWKTALENVAIGLESAGTDKATARARAQAWLNRMGLAQVLRRDPKILLMDEPFGPLDAQTRQIMGNLLLDLWGADRKAVLFVTHDLEEAIALADRVVIMSAGPAARIIGDWRVPLSRPRWHALKTEVLKGYAQTGGG